MNQEHINELDKLYEVLADVRREVVYVKNREMYLRRQLKDRDKRIRKLTRLLNKAEK